MQRIKEVKVISDKYIQNIKKMVNSMCKEHNVVNIQIVRDDINYFNAFIMIGYADNNGKKK